MIRAITIVIILVMTLVFADVVVASSIPSMQWYLIEPKLQLLRLMFLNIVEKVT